MSPMQPLLSVHALSLGYKVYRGLLRLSSYQRCYEDIHFEIAPGELIGILGPNGVGKTTLLKTCAGLIQPLQGHIQLAQVNLQDYSPLARAQKIALVFSGRQGMSQLKVSEILGAGRYPHTGFWGKFSSVDWKIQEEIISHFKLGSIGMAKIQTLSDGKAQMVFLARALIQQPQLLLLDEPTAFLDLVYKKELMNCLIHEVKNKNRAALLTTHDPELAQKYCDRIILMGHHSRFKIIEAKHLTEAELLSTFTPE